MMHTVYKAFTVAARTVSSVLQWCAQTVPSCGSYQENLVGLLLPALAQAISAQENGQTQNEALSAVMPQLLQVSPSGWFLDAIVC